MYLKELIEALEAADQSHVCEMGFAHPHSYRGYYDQLAFEPARNVRVADMLDCAREALGATYEGYKGGDYTMGEYTDVWLAKYGCCGEGIGPVLLGYMLGTHNAGVQPPAASGSAGTPCWADVDSLDCKS